MKIAAIASYNAAPSILTVAPNGKTNLLMRGSTLLFSSMQRIVVGRVAALDMTREKEKEIKQHPPNIITSYKEKGPNRLTKPKQYTVDSHTTLFFRFTQEPWDANHFSQFAIRLSRPQMESLVITGLVL